MKRIYEPQDIGELPDDSGVTPNLEILERALRMHFHADGVTFGQVDPRNPQFSAVISYDSAREMMLFAAAEQQREEAKSK